MRFGAWNHLVTIECTLYKLWNFFKDVILRCIRHKNFVKSEGMLLPWLLIQVFCEYNTKSKTTNKSKICYPISFPLKFWIYHFALDQCPVQKLPLMLDKRKPSHQQMKNHHQATKVALYRIHECSLSVPVTRYSSVGYRQRCYCRYVEESFTKMVLCNFFLSISPSITLNSASSKRLCKSLISLFCSSNSDLVSSADKSDT